MNFSNFYMLESKLPPGFSNDDIYSADLILKNVEDEIEEAIDDAEVRDFDMDKFRKKSLDYKKLNAKDRQKINDKPSKIFHVGNLCVKGEWIDDNVLMNKMMVRPKQLLGQNEKMQKSGVNQVFYDITLPGYMGLFVDEESRTFKTVKTCPSAGNCIKQCYARKGNFVRFPHPSMMASRVVTYLMNDYEGFKNQLISELKEKVIEASTQGFDIVLRWHDSGDFISDKYLLMAYEIARETPEVLHYAYTKNVPLLKKYESKKPKNFVYRFSFYGKHDKDIDLKKDLHAIIVPRELFRDIKPIKKISGAVIYSPESIELIKNRIANHYKIKLDTIKTSAEMRKIPISKTKKWNVVIWYGAGDESALRSDVLGVYLFEH